VLVRVDEHAVVAADPAAERVEPLAQDGVAVVPAVPREPPFARLERRLRRVVAVRSGDDRARAGSSFSGWHETSGWAIVNRMSAKSPRAFRSRM
jgi:hypothetical protein